MSDFDSQQYEYRRQAACSPVTPQHSSSLRPGQLKPRGLSSNTAPANVVACISALTIAS